MVDAEVGRRGLCATQGGSFGFRGHRYELIEPDHEDGVPFLRVALGFRGGRTLDELIVLFRELASRPRLESQPGPINQQGNSRRRRCRGHGHLTLPSVLAPPTSSTEIHRSPRNVDEA